MRIIWRIIICGAWLVLNFYIGECHKGKTILEKDLTADERHFIDFLRIYLHFSSLYIAYHLISFE